MANEYKKAQQGDEKAQQTLFDMAKQRVWVICRSLLLEDSVAETVFLAVFKEAGPLLADQNVTDTDAWIHRLLRNAAVRCRRHLTQQKQGIFRLPKDGVVLKTADLPEEPYTDHALDNFLLCLPPLQRFIFVLRYGAGMDSREIAELMELRKAEIDILEGSEPESLGHIYSRLKRANARAVMPTSPLLQDAFAMAETISPITDETEKLALTAFLQDAPKPEHKKPGLWFKVFVISLILMLLAGIIAIVTINQKAKEIQAEAAARESLQVAEENTDSEASDQDAEPTDNAFQEITVPQSTEAPEDETTADASEKKAITTYADITIEDYGTITVQLDADAAPLTVANFIKLAESGFYDGLTFHRIIDGFMMQGGDPNGNGTGGSDETVKGEFSDNGWDNPLSHTRGAISMARSTDADSASSQFFIVQSDSTYLDGSYAVFGYVTEGMDIVDQICADAQPTDSNGTIATDRQPVITSIVIREVTEDVAS